MSKQKQNQKVIELLEEIIASETGYNFSSEDDVLSLATQALAELESESNKEKEEPYHLHIRGEIHLRAKTKEEFIENLKKLLLLMEQE